MTTVPVGGSDMVALAQLMLEVDDARAAADDQDMRAAHDTERQELERQVQALHDAASDTRLGAALEGAMGLAGGTVSIVGTATAPAGPADTSHASVAACAAAEKQSKVVLAVGNTLTTLARPTSALAAGGPEKDAEARAKNHEALASDANERFEAAQRHHDRVLDDDDRTLSTLQTTLQSEADGNLAIIANA